MAERIIMPKQGLQMTEGLITQWLVPEGGDVKAGEPLFTMETDKLTITIDAPVSGTLLKITAGEGETAPVAGTIAIVGNPGENIDGFLQPAQPPVAGVVTKTGRQGDSAVQANKFKESADRTFISPRARMRAAEAGLDCAGVIGTGDDGMIVERDIVKLLAERPKATPLAKKAAENLRLDLAGVEGSGPHGKILRKDVESAYSGTKRKIVPMRGMRKVIADRMRQSLAENAQAYHRVSVRMDEAARLRLALNKTVGYSDLIVMAAARALRDCPAMNAQVTEEGIWRKDFVHIGVAVALEEGLVVPVIRNADKKTLPELSECIRGMANKARSGALSPEDCEGGGFTVSNLGMYGLEEFMAIINPPEAGILAVGQIADAPVAVDGRVEIHPVMKLTLSYDHRVIDGAPAAKFLTGIKEYLENPYQLL